MSTDFDRWYAARTARFLVEPSSRLETFGNTLVNYHLISELLDRPGKVRVREGRLEAHQPQIIAPRFETAEMEGFGPEAEEYFRFLQTHEDQLRIIQYGYRLKQDNFSEYVVTGNLAAVTEQVKSAVLASGDHLAAVIQGVDEPWDVALVELWRREIRRSLPHHLEELNRAGRLFPSEAE